MKHDFDIGPEGFCSYDYEGCVRAGRNIFVLAAWSPTGGVGDSGHIWTNQAAWSADTPEDPISVFAFTLRRSDGSARRIVRHPGAPTSRCTCRATASRCTAPGPTSGSTGAAPRGTSTAHPLEIGDGEWPSEPNRFKLEADESLWHQTWTPDPAGVRGIEAALTECSSIAVQLSGFTSLPAGKIAMDELEIRLP